MILGLLCYPLRSQSRDFTLGLFFCGWYVENVKQLQLPTHNTLLLSHCIVFKAKCVSVQVSSFDANGETVLHECHSFTQMGGKKILWRLKFKEILLRTSGIPLYNNKTWILMIQSLFSNVTLFKRKALLINEENILAKQSQMTSNETRRLDLWCTKKDQLNRQPFFLLLIN